MFLKSISAYLLLIKSALLTVDYMIYYLFLILRGLLCSIWDYFTRYFVCVFHLCISLVSFTEDLIVSLR